MSEYSPLKTPELRAIEDSLNANELDNAQRLLAQLGAHSDLQHGTSYLASRLLFLRGRLDPASVIERMRELVGANPHFTEARFLMEHCQRLLKSSGSEAPPSGTPRPRSLFPSAPPDATSDTSLQSSRPEPLPLDDLALGDDEPPASWPVPGFEPTEHFNDPPTFTPHLRSGEQLDDPAGLAPTEYPAAFASPEVVLPSFAPPPPAREIRVDTRPSVIPASGSLPPPLRYGAPVPKQAGRYFSNDPEAEPSDTDALSTAASPFSGRYRMMNVPVDVVSHKPEPRDASGAPPTPRQSPAQRASIPAPDDVHLDLDDRDQPTPFRVPRPDLHLSLPPSSRDVPASYGFSDPERNFGRGDPGLARNRFELKALEALQDLADGFDSFESKATLAASALSLAPVVHYFAPFDRSLCSLPRLELALRTLYLGVNHLPTSSIRPLVALYLGESLRLSHRGTWRGVPERPTTWAVEAGAHIWQPYRCAGQFLAGPPGQALLGAAGGGLAKRGTIAWMASAPVRTTLSKPWQEPLTPQNLLQLGEMVTHTPWSICCETLFGQGLDGSVTSLRALDQLLDVLCDSAEAPRPLDSWLVRTATLAGAYVGKVLAANAQAHWLEQSATSEQSAALELPGGIIATPAANIAARATSRKRSQLFDYVRALLRRSG